MKLDKFTEKRITKTCLAKVADHFLYEGPHWCNVDYLEFLGVDCTVLVDVFANLPQHCQQRYVRFTSTLHTLMVNNTNGV